MTATFGPAFTPHKQSTAYADAHTLMMPLPGFHLNQHEFCNVSRSCKILLSVYGRDPDVNCDKPSLGQTAHTEVVLEEGLLWDTEPKGCQAVSACGYWRG
jgi:hypothetical protein